MSKSLSIGAGLKTRELISNNLPIVSLSVLAILVLYGFLSSLRERSKIRSLGSFAPKVASSLPFAIGVTYYHIKCTLRNQDLSFWEWLFSHSPHKGSPTVETTAGGQRYVFTADPENIKAVLATQFQDYGKGSKFHEDWKLFLGDGIFNTDGQIWHQNRALLRPQFVKERISDLDIFETHVQKLMKIMPAQGEMFDIAELFYRYSLDAATEFLCGQSAVGHLDNPDAVLPKNFNHVSRMQSLITRMRPFSVLLPRLTLKRSLGVVNAFVEPYVDRVLNPEPQQASKEDRSFLRAIALAGVREKAVIRDQFVNILLAARDSTAAALSFTFLELSWNPEVVQKLRKEILETIGDESAPTYQDLKDMRYLRCVLNEVLRLYPALPFNIRWSLRDTTLPTGGGPDGKQPIGIPKDTAIAYSPLCLHRRTDLYPTDSPDPLEFHPDRWNQWIPPSWQYLPFNGGPRICLGQQFALTELSYTIVRILQRYDRIDAYSSKEGPRYKTQVVIAPVHGVKIGLWKASSPE